MITAAVVAYMCIVFFAAFFLKSAVEFWILAILVGMFQGGIQALSRSYYGKIIPKDHANEYYGFYDIFGKTASIIGTFLVATTTSLTGNASLGVLSIAVLLVAALVFLLLQRTRRGSDLPALGNSVPRATSRSIEILDIGCRRLKSVCDMPPGISIASPIITPTQMPRNVRKSLSGVTPRMELSESNRLPMPAPR